MTSTAEPWERNVVDESVDDFDVSSVVAEIQTQVQSTTFYFVEKAW